MSRYFKYKTAPDLAREIESLGLSLRLDEDLAPLREKVEVAGRTVGNRLAVQPMEGCDATPDGEPDELTVRRFRRFGDGGAKLIWGEAAAVAPEGRANPRQLVIDEARLGGLANLAFVCREAHRSAWGDDGDLLLGLQLTHSGRYSVARPVLAQHDPLLDPRTIVDKGLKIAATAATPLISDDELMKLQDRYVDAAGVASRAGFDFVDLKQCHRYLLSELLSAETRPGRFGGSFEDRTRFIRELAGRIRGEFPGLMVATRLNVHDGLPYHRGADGLGVADPFDRPCRSAWGSSRDDPTEPDLSEPIALVGLLKGLGVGLVNVTLGNPYASPHLLRPFEYAPVDGYETPEHPLIGVDRHVRLTGEIQRAHPDVAVVGSGYSWLQSWAFHAGSATVRGGGATFIGLGRGSLSHPDVARHVLEGRPLDPKKTCRTFSYCTSLMRSKNHPLGQFPAGCPPFDKPTYGPIWKDAQAAAESR